ncbi:MAG: DUF6157 family protein [Aggregatilineales bacterium]
MAYKDTFIKVAPDSDATTGTTPTSNRKTTPIHIHQYNLLMDNPYTYTHEDLVYEVHVLRQGFSPEDLAAREVEIKRDLFSKGHPCMRASSLTKKYGWGAHYNEDGKIALYAIDSDEYRKYIESATDVIDAMRSKRKRD